MVKQNMLCLYNETLKRNDVLIHATTWMNHENTLLSERNQTQKAKYHYDSMKYPE